MRWSANHTRQSFSLLRAYGKPHRKWLAKGLSATSLVVMLRLALPWPLRWIIEGVIKPNHLNSSEISLSNPWLQELIWLATAFVILAASLGFAEFHQRVSMKQYATNVVHAIREKAVRVLTHLSPGNSDIAPDAISRVVSDSARIKAELSGILVHASQNGLLYLGITAVFLYLSPKLGLFFVAGGVLTVLIGLNASDKVAVVSLKQRRKESEFATVIQAALDQGYLDAGGSKVNGSSARSEVRATRLMARTTWSIHVALSFVIAVALWTATMDVISGRLLPGELFLFMAYVMSVHRRMVQVGRQLARSGKLLANLSRLGDLTNRAYEDESAPITHLSRLLELQSVTVRRGSKSKGTNVLRKICVTIGAGEKVAVLGRSGSGKSIFLRAITGQIRFRGKILWDDKAVSQFALHSASTIRFLPQTYIFKRRRIRSFVRSANESKLEPELNQALEIQRLINNLPAGLDAKVSSAVLTRSEARSLALYDLLSSKASSLWVLDSPTDDLSPKQAIRQLTAITARTDGRTLIVSLPSSKGVELFDRVLLLKRGKLIFDGSVGEWQRHRREKKVTH